MTNWHRLFGLVLTDFFTGSPFVVELEKDLSLKKQLLDVVIIRRETGTFTEDLPDGLDNLAAHNLISFKSHQETLDAWAVKELIGHYVNYRKQVSPSLQELLPEDEIHLYAVCARFPAQLAGQIDLQQVQSGVYDCCWGTDVVRIIVLGQLSAEERNAPLQLFSAAPDRIQYARDHYRQHSPDSSTLIERLLVYYQQEGIAMPYTMEDFRREVKKEYLEGLTPEERQEVFVGISAEERQQMLEKLPPVERRDLLERLPIDERLRGLTAEEIRAYLKKLKGETPSGENS